eukprot:15028429-Ditylum_brightwellii.AAC.1
MVNFLTMESISVLPPQCNGVLLAAWGSLYILIGQIMNQKKYMDRVKGNLLSWDEIGIGSI